MCVFHNSSLMAQCFSWLLSIVAERSDEPHGLYLGAPLHVVVAAQPEHTDKAHL